MYLFFTLQEPESESREEDSVSPTEDPGDASRGEVNEGADDGGVRGIPEVRALLS
jgi:hypothetical protein